MNRLCMGCMREYDDRFDICPHCGYIFNTPARQAYHITPGTILNNRYIVGKVLGFGGFGVTYIGWDYVMCRRVAIKEYLPSEFATRAPSQNQVTVYSGDRQEQFREGLAKMMDEARRLAKFDHVSGIVQIFDCFEANGTSYLVMEYLDGVTLKEYLENHGTLTVEQAMSVIIQIASAMDIVHKAGILHRDIAPDNIYVLNPECPDNLRVKLLDFGAARYATTKHSKSLSVIIKPGYAPIEQYRSRSDQGTWTDVYALAATFYKMLTGVTPDDAMERYADDRLKKPSRFGCRISKPMETALMNALNVRIEDRTQTMLEFAEELTNADVEAHRITREKTDLGKVPKVVLALAGAGSAAAILAAVLIGTGIWAPSIQSEEHELESSMVRVPNVVNKEVDQAEQILELASLKMVRDRAVYSDEIPENMVCYQAVKDSAAVSKHTTLLVWVSKGAEKGVLPHVMGLDQDTALMWLGTAGFTNITVSASQEPGPYHTVVQISHQQGELTNLSEEIHLVVCMNEEDQSGDEAAVVVMPDVIGMDVEKAEDLLETQQLRVNLAEEFSDRPENTIIRQEPWVGTELNQGVYVTIVVSKGPEKIFMEYVRDIPEQEARDQILALGLQVGSVAAQYSDTIPEGNVIGQSIASNTEVKKGDVVDLIISLGRDPAQIQPDQDALAMTQEQERQQAAVEEEARRQAEAQAQAEEARRQAEAALEAELRRQEEETEGSRVVSASGARTTARLIEVENVCGMTLERATAVLENQDLKAGKVTREYSDSVPEGYVIAQDEEAGEEVRKGSKIRLTVSKGPDPDA